MPLNLLLVILSFVIGISITDYIRSYDIHEKEPLHKMFLVVLWGGAWSVGITILTYQLLGKAGLGKIDNFFGAVFVIGPVEEAAKLLALLSSYYFIRKDLNEPTDGLIYMTCVALGFSLIENYFYATRTPDSGILLFLRLFISTPVHILSSIFMGIAFFDIMKLRTGVGILLVSFCYASLVHGLFDAILFSKWILAFLFLVICFSQRWALSLLSYTTAKSPFRRDLKAFIENCKTERKTGLECLNCGNINDKDTYIAQGFSIQKCDQCPSYISTKDSLFKLFRFFGSVFKDPTQYYWDAKFYNRPYSTLYKGNSVSDQKNLAFFLLDELNEALNELNRSIVTDFERNWWFPKKLRSAPDTEESKNHEDTGSKNPLFITTLLMGVIITLVFTLVDLDRESWFALLFLGYPFLIFFYLILYLLVKLFVKTRKA
jgi:RsiW-degrading membrane proteinase PrsW (M82 family)